MKLETALKAIIEQSKPSSFRDEAFQRKKDMKGKARDNLIGLSYIEKISPGYYGSKGSAEVTMILVNLFVKTKVLTPELANPLRQMEYVQEVLVPESGVRLIAEDLSIQSEEAQKVMLESVEFGNYMHDIQVYEEPGQALLI
ncbi:hypothetical protein BGZ46_009491 [Entomortierella lignicola]|nr:hypothetical protein BGZ46_009491 [Entomortierella lignicola]